MRLLTLKPDQVQKLIDFYENECTSIKKSAMQMAWYMRGGMSYEDILNMSSEERKQINAIIEHNLDVTKKSQLPFF